jgi:hypothetical protein
MPSEHPTDTESSPVRIATSDEIGAAIAHAKLYDQYRRRGASVVCVKTVHTSYVVRRRVSPSDGVTAESLVARCKAVYGLASSCFEDRDDYMRN